jgi:hypothetical protein
LTLTENDARALIADKRRLTLGPLIESCTSRKAIRPEYQSRFEAFRAERHWLVHRSLVENGDDIQVDAGLESLIARITRIQEEAISLKKAVGEDFFSWMAAHGVRQST